MSPVKGGKDAHRPAFTWHNWVVDTHSPVCCPTSVRGRSHPETCHHHVTVHWQEMTPRALPVDTWLRRAIDTQRQACGHAMQCWQRRSPTGPTSTWPVYSGSHHIVQVCGRQMGEKEKQNNLSIVKGDGTRDAREERNEKRNSLL